MKLKRLFSTWIKKGEKSMWYSCENERLKGCVDSYISILTKTLISSIQRGCFLNQLKLVEVTPDLKKEDELSKENYLPVSILSYTSKIFEKIAFNQMNLFFESRFSPLLTRFRKKHNKQNSLLNIIEKWKHALDKDKKFSTIFMDLSKAFDTLNSFMTEAVII